MSPRNPDGRFRNLNQPTVLSSEMQRARWVEIEAMRLKLSGLSYEAVAQYITQVGRGLKPPVTPLLEGTASRPIIRLPPWPAIKPCGERFGARPLWKRMR